MAEGHPCYPPASNNQTEPENQLPENPATRDDTDGSDDSGAPRNGKGSYQPLLQPPPHVGVARPEQQQNNFAYGPPSVPQPELALRPHPQMNPPYGPPAQQQNNYLPLAFAYPPFAYGPPPQIQQNNLPPYGWAPHQIQPINPHYHYGPPPPPPNYGSVMEAYDPINYMAPVSGPRMPEANIPKIAEESKTNIRLSIFCCIGSILLCALSAIPFGICALVFANSSVKLRNKEQFDESIKRGRYAKYASIIAGVCACLWVCTIIAIFMIFFPITYFIDPTFY
jgi:hypothetical protein